ncbi:uncharacterized protein VTP21DRAFT_2017 [Calcarisporiella thermophila]|uniref:uncharacterized protein n=1 Tax=Calcarisporiella thermophila TaxID=911321 RepID=UPI003743D87C
MAQSRSSARPHCYHRPHWPDFSADGHKRAPYSTRFPLLLTDSTPRRPTHPHRGPIALAAHVSMRCDSYRRHASSTLGAQSRGFYLDHSGCMGWYLFYHSHESIKRKSELA